MLGMDAGRENVTFRRSLGRKPASWPARTKEIFVLSPASLLAGFTLICAASAAEPDRSQPPAAPNQSVSIEPSGLAPADAPGVELGSGEHGVAAAIDPPPELQAETRAAESVRLSRRASKPLGLESATPSRPLPWYRTQFGSLAIVVGAIALVFWALRKWVPYFRVVSSPVMKVAARASLGPRQTLMLVQLGRRFVMVAVSPGRVDTVCQIDDVQEAAELTAHIGGPGPGMATQFDRLLHQEAAEADSAGAADRSELRDEAGSLPQPVAVLLERLKRLRRSA